MTSEEIRLAKLSKTLNNSSVNYNFHVKADESAYKQTISTLQKTLNEEKSRLKSDKLNYNLSVNAKLNEEDLKQQAYRHHFQVLEAQIKEKQLKKQIKSERIEPNFTSYTPETPTGKNYKLRDELLRQIEEKEQTKKKQAEHEVIMGKKLIENSNKLLDNEFEARLQAKKKAYQDMINSWEETMKVSKMQKELEKIRMFGPKVENNYIQPVIEEEDQMPETPLPTYQAKNRTKKVLDKTFDWKKNLRSSSVKSPSSVKSGQSFNSVIEKFSVLNSREKSLKQDKEKLLKYFEERQKTRSKDFKLPKIV